MDKKTIATVMMLIVFVAGIVWIICFEGESSGAVIDIGMLNKERDSTTNERIDLNYDEIRGVWISYIDLQNILKGTTKKEFEANMDEVISNMKLLDLNTAIVQVRAFADAIYSSDYYQWSTNCVNSKGKIIDFDPLKIMVDKFHKSGIRIEAWVNPYRIKSTESKVELIKEPIKGWIESGSPNIVETKSGLFLDPASSEVQKLIVSGITEIVKNYDVDGIHFDDYFYPDSGSFDDGEYNSYIANGGKLTKADWRRENVNTLVKGVYSAIKKVDSSVVFGISPQGNLKNNYDAQYIDVEKWIENDGYVDYICPQIYYGFNNSTSGFEKVISEFESMNYKKTKLYIGIAAYKVGSLDKNAGEGMTEWLDSDGILKKQIDRVKSSKVCKGYILFRYDSIFNPSSDSESRVKSEIEKLMKN